MGSFSISGVLTTSGGGRIYHNYFSEFQQQSGFYDAPYFRVTCNLNLASDDGKAYKKFKDYAKNADNNAWAYDSYEGSSYSRYSYKPGETPGTWTDYMDRYGAGWREDNFALLTSDDGESWSGYAGATINYTITGKWGDTPEDVLDCTPWAKSVKVTLFADVNGTRQASKKTVGLSDSGETQVNFDSSDFGGEDYSLLGVRVYNDTSSRLPDGFGYRVNLRVTKKMTLLWLTFG